MPEEATLLERVRRCETTALAQVYDDYYDRIYRYVYGYIGRPGAAEDLTANVFFRLLRAVRDGKSPRSNLSAWLYRVAHNLVVDSFRRGPPEELELAEWLESDEPDPAYTAEQRMQVNRVRVALRDLTDSQQQVIMLKFFQGMDTREVAATLNKSEGAIDALQHRGLRALRKALQQPTEPGSPPQEMGGASSWAQSSEDGDGSVLRMSQAGLPRLLLALQHHLVRSTASSWFSRSCQSDTSLPSGLRKASQCQPA